MSRAPKFVEGATLKETIPQPPLTFAHWTTMLCTARENKIKEEADQFHEDNGHFGSSLLTIRKDLAKLAEALSAEDAIHYKVQDQLASEYHYLELGQYVLSMQITSAKPTSHLPMPFRHSDTVLKLNAVNSGISQKLKASQAKPISEFLLCAFKRQGDVPSFIADCDTSEWNVIFFDAKARTRVTIDIYHQ